MRSGDLARNTAHWRHAFFRLRCRICFKYLRPDRTLKKTQGVFLSGKLYPQTPHISNAHSNLMRSNLADRQRHLHHTMSKNNFDQTRNYTPEKLKHTAGVLKRKVACETCRKARAKVHLELFVFGINIYTFQCDADANFPLPCSRCVKKKAQCKVIQFLMFECEFNLVLYFSPQQRRRARRRTVIVVVLLSCPG